MALAAERTLMPEPLARCGAPQAWHGCYSGQTALLTEASFAHPAKMPASLCYRILEHLEGLGLLKPADVVLDPMAGTGMTGLCWAAKGGRAILVELEPKFIGFCQANKAQLEKTLGHPVEIEIIQGDARHLSQLLKERGLISVTSPPYQDTIKGGRSGIDWQPEWGKASPSRQPSQDISYGSTPGQIASLPDRPLKCVTSPPYEDSDNRGASKGIDSPEWRARRKKAGLLAPMAYEDKDQIGQQRGETYLTAMARVFQECAKICDVLVSVSKNPTRDGKLRDLSGDLETLLEAAGFRILCHHHSILFEEQTQGHLFEGSRKKVKGRLSFFKRLSWQKGAPVAQWEDVLVAVRDNPGGVKVVTSAPYGEVHSEGGGVLNTNRRDLRKWVWTKGTQGDTPGQIGNLPDRPLQDLSGDYSTQFPFPPAHPPDVLPEKGE